MKQKKNSINNKIGVGINKLLICKNFVQIPNPK